MKRMVIPFLAALIIIISSVDKSQAVTLDKPHDFSCATCHTPHKTQGSTGYNNICLSCHRGGDPMAGAKSFAPGDAADPFNYYTSGISNRYQISHRWDGFDTSLLAGASSPTLAQMTSVQGRTSNSMACVRCHNPHSQANKPFLRMANDSDQMCTDCHNSRNTTDQIKGTHPVGIDYQQKATANPAAFNASPVNANSLNPTSAMKLIGGKVSCSTCHGVHTTDSNSATFDSFSTLSDLQPSDGNLLRTDRRAATADGLNICTNCHAGKVAHNGRDQNVQCTDCHGAHVDTGDGSVPNVWLVKRDMGTGKGTVQFTSVIEKNYMDGAGKGVCQSCHAVPTGAGFQFHLTETNATCNNCHTHGNSKGAFSVDASSACNACHGYPPLLNSAGPGGYAAGYDATTSFVDERFSGHGSHVSSPYQKACSSCHSGNSHVTGTYQDVFVGTANYDKAAQTCSNVYCHSNANPRGGTNITKTTPSWNGAKGKLIGAAGECGACHNAAGDSSPSWSASHTRHINGYAANAKFSCNACHAKTAASNAAVFGNMTARSLHTNGIKDVAFNSFAGAGAWDTGSATCSNLYCHSNVQGVNGTGAPTTFNAATWNGAAMTCGSCHASMTTDTSSVTGNHKLHVQGYGFDCSTCHGTGYSATGNTAPATTHVDGSITMSLTDTAAINGATPSYYQGNNSPGNGYNNCATIYCHSNVQGSGGAGAPSTFEAPVWGAGAVACGSCHANMATSGAATGNHKQHAQTAGISCVTCHNGAGKDPNPPYTATPKHANGSIDIAFSGSAVGTAYSKGATVNPGAGYGSCSTVTCHADPYSTAPMPTAPVWGAASAGCATCHSGIGAFGAYSSPSTGSHVKHIAGTGVLCNQCHVGAVKGATGGTAHANGVVNVDVALGYYSSSIIKHASGTYAVNATCSTAVCHSDPYSAAQAISPAWGTPSGCESCHNNGGGFTGTGNGPATGSHNKHMAATALPVNCGDCHSGAVAVTNGGLSHANGVVNVTQGYYSSSVGKHAAGTYAANAKCSTTCHTPYTTPVATPAWGTASTCSSCHESAPNTGSHGFHLNRFAGCTDCHGALSDVNGGAAHLNGNINVTNGYPVTTKHAAGTGYSGTCSTALCHPNPYGTGSAVTPIWGATSGCSACHTTAIGINGPATGSHTTVAGHAVACINCHAADTTETVAPVTGHADGDIDVANVGYATLNKTKGTAGTTCSSASCHASPVAATLIVTPAWGTTGNGCTACHAGANAITANGPATGSHTTIAGHAVACITCHAAGTTATVAPSTGHADGNIDVANVGYATLNKTKGTLGVTCSTSSCHGSSSPAWGANTANNACTKCHGTGTVTVTASNYEVVAPSGAQADTGQVSTGKIGAHQTHLKYFNGLSQQGADSQARCQICHTVPGTNNHANANSTPAFTGLALGTGTYATSYSAGTCAVYCHNPTGTGGTLAAGNAPTVTTAAWTDAAYITDGTLKTDANCNKCHKSPNGSNVISSITSHAGFTIATACTPCHAHEGNTASGTAGRQHIDGVKWGSGGAGGCVGCHGYGVGTWAAAPAINAEGKGAHEAHITYLTTKRFTVTLAPLTDTYGGATTAWTNVCGICHSGGTHTNNSVEVSVSSTYLFGTGSTLYSGTPGISSATTAKTCSNISCHYFTTPLWSTY